MTAADVLDRSEAINGRDGLRRDRPRLPGARVTGRRRGELVVGLLLVAGCALGAVVAATSGRSRTPVLALDGPLARGEVVDDADLRTTYVNADEPVAHIDTDDRSAVVGRVALVDLAAGTIVTPEHFAGPAEVTAPGDGTVGLTMDAGQLPTLPLAAGDRVSVVGPAGGTADPAQPPAPLATAEVVGSEELEDDSWWVSLRSGEAVAAAVAGGARLQLVLVGR